ncbi:MAG: thrombospondin type 3 repeat-containing protein [Chloroflexi bacterium]|nr:thrombospondin type 3 repeat-containing protein [Chloroflexota bacterium]
MTADEFVSRLRYVGLVALTAIAVSLALWSQGERVSATSFAPTYQVTMADATPGASSAISFEFNVAAPDANFQSLVTFVPGSFSFAGDDAVPDGALTGTIEADATLGLINGACNSVLTVPFELMDATTDITSTIPLYSGLVDFDGDGLVENVTRYPSFLTLIAPDLQPIQRLYGQSLVAGLWAPVNFVVFEPGARIPLFPEFDESLGYPILITLLDPTAPIENSSISDFCSPILTTTELFGLSEDNPSTAENEGGSVLLTNPDESGHYAWTIFARGQWDADDDGIENQLDSCPYDADPNWDPRANTSPGDADSDGLPGSCDPNDSSTNFDQDGDGWLNRLDLCPTLVNSSSFFMFDADNDGVGDECDRAPNDASDGGLSHRHQVCVTSFVTIGSPVGGQPDDPACPEGPDLSLPPRFSAFADTPFAAVGDEVTVTARVEDRLTSQGLEGVDVGFEVTGANPGVGVCVTDLFGACAFSYTGLNPGIDTIDVSASVDGVELSESVGVEWVVPPPNDDFADATLIPGLPYEHEQVIVGAGPQEGEPSACPSAQQTVWFNFTPDVDTFVQSRLTGSGTAAIYRGDDLDELELIECQGGQVISSTGTTAVGSANGLGPPVLVAYALLEAGVTYHFQVTVTGSGFVGNVTFELVEGTLGDASCDGTIAATDALLVLTQVAFGGAFGCIAGGDMNCDGAWSATDALEILRRVAGLSSKTGCV